MSICIVTGAAGFIGSHLCKALLSAGHSVRGVDAFVPYYPRVLKEANLSALLPHPQFELLELDLRTDELAPALQGADVIFHLAAQAGLRRSWQDFDSYMTCNVLATQRLLEAAVTIAAPHFINISTSSVYGRFATGDEESPLAPVSPYGITKLAAEHLCRAYAQNNDLPLTVLRLYSVYGPGQRPDMGYNIFIRRILEREVITIDGDGTDSRSNTFVTDCVEGILLAFSQPGQSKGETFNIGGGEEVNVLEVLKMLESLSGIAPITRFGPPRAGDQRRTVADTSKARRLLGYDPKTSVMQGLRAQLEWQQRQIGLHS